MNWNRSVGLSVTRACSPADCAKAGATMPLMAKTISMRRCMRNDRTTRYTSPGTVRVTRARTSGRASSVLHVVLLLTSFVHPAHYLFVELAHAGLGKSIHKHHIVRQPPLRKTRLEVFQNFG